jgi:hypothetical protein
MNIQELKITQIKVNGENPRSITGDKFNKLVNSILVFPKMLRLRPIVIDKMFTVIGGNMRTNALREIAKMSAEKLVSRLGSLAEYKQRNETERKTIAEYWKKWLKNPVAPTVNAAELTATEREEFIIKDNVSFGNWDYDMLANNFDSSALQSWGMDVWNPQPFAPPTGNGYQAQPQGQPSYSDAPSDAENDGNFEESLPPELQGIDLTAPELPKIQGNDERPMERVIIVFKKEDADKVAALIGIEKLEKIIYEFDELRK